MKIIDIEKEIAKYEDYQEGAVSEKLYKTLKTQLEKIKTIVGPEI